MCKALADHLKINENDIIVASTGVIGMPLPLEPIINGIPTLCEQLDSSPEGSFSASMAIMTTDTRRKEIAAEFMIGEHKCRIGGIAKGSGMISPNMATMLAFVTTDISIDSGVLQVLLKKVADKSFNMISVDGDTSTNDTLTVMASGLSGNAEIKSESDLGYAEFQQALLYVCTYLAKHMAADGEGATKLIECRIRNCDSENKAKILAKSVINSPLVKTAMYGADANWGRVLCALGYAGQDIDAQKIEVNFISNAGEINVCKNGGNVGFSEEKAKEILLRDNIIIDVDLHIGDKNATAWGCDLSYEYVRINGDYRS